MGGTSKTDEDLKAIGLKPPEIKLWRALEADEPYIFDPDGPEAERALRGDILGAILRGDKVEGATPPPLPRQIGVYGAAITGVLDVSDTDLSRHALALENCRFDGCPDFLRADFAALDFEDSQFKQGGRFADIYIRGNLFMDGVQCDGELALHRAKIGGQFSAKSAHFSNPKKNAIMAQGATIQDGVFLDGAKITGCTFFAGANIGGGFSANGAHFSNPNGNAINAEGADIQEDVLLDRTKIIGRATFSGANIGGQFSANGARFINPEGTAFTMQGATVSDSTWLTEFPHPPIGDVNFTRANLGEALIDYNSYSIGKFTLDGAQYQNVQMRVGNVWTVPKMEGWLCRPKDVRAGDGRHAYFWQCYAPTREYAIERLKDKNLADDELSQITLATMDELQKGDDDYNRTPFAYRQFARVLDANGHEREARSIRIEAGHAYTNRIAKTFNAWRARLYRVWRTLLRYMIGYGVKPWRVFYFVAVWWSIGFIVFSLCSPHMTPAREKFYLTQTEADGSFKDISPGDLLPKGYPDFSPFVYALDVMLPVVDFAQESHWRPKNVGAKRWNWLRIFNRFYLAFGWAFSTIAVLGFTGLISDRKDSLD